ncbi:MAG TPA: amidohydrolase family protein [Thermoanaerobaculia bacterium]|jgi:cytosine/adenosine deaminase-related metal-dependent hydrolase|nr:amidohydrolase family protein [Thermoanaerobaculia bacterium]
MTRQEAMSLDPPLLLRGGTILTLDAEATVLRGADLLVAGGTIAAAGQVAVPPEARDLRVIDISGCLVLPGLIQGHLHLGQTFFRALAEGRRLLAWLRERIWPLEAAHDDESAYWCGLLGAAECLLGGTTTIQDIGIGPGAPGLLRAIAESGLRAFAGPCLMDSGDGLPAAMRGATDTVLAAAESLGERFERAGHGRLRAVLNPRFILTCSDPLWEGIRDLAERRGWPVHTHALEQQDETAAVREIKNGRDEIRYFADQGVLSTDLRLAHGVWLTAGHLEHMHGNRFSVVHCPSSNLKLGSGIADVLAIRRAGVPVGIGTDGAACSNQLDNFAELRLAALLQKLKHGPDAFSGLDALRLATSEGARALGLHGHTGTIEPGKAADLVVLSAANHPELWGAPQADPHDLVAFGASRAAVRHVIVDGQILVEEGRLTRLDAEEIFRESDRCLRELIRRSGVDF